MLPAHVAVNDTFAVVVPVGVTVYFRLPQPVGGVDGVIEVQAPANASTEVVGVGLVGDAGVSVLSFFYSKSQPVVSAHASAKAAAAARSFIDPAYRQYDF
jgi:hypothetical protein